MSIDLIVPFAVGAGCLGMILYVEAMTVRRAREQAELVRERAGRTPPLTRR